MVSRKPETMVESVSAALKAVWWLPLLRGLALIVLGVLVVIQPLGTLLILSRITAIFLLVDGVIAILQGLLNRTQTGWRIWLVQGLVDLVFALLILFWPGLTVAIFFYLLVVWTIALGAVAIASSAMLARNKDLTWPWLLAFGLLSVLFGVMLLLRSGDDVARTLQVVGLVLGIYAFIAGAIQIVSAFSVRAVARDIDEALKGNSPVLNAINLREENYAESKAERAAERAAEREEAKAEREAEKQQRNAEKEAEHAAEKERKEAERAAEKENWAAEKQAERDSEQGRREAQEAQLAAGSSTVPAGSAPAAGSVPVDGSVSADSWASADASAPADASGPADLAAPGETLANADTWAPAEAPETRATRRQAGLGNEGSSENVERNDPEPLLIDEVTPDSELPPKDA